MNPFNFKKASVSVGGPGLSTGGSKGGLAPLPLLVCIKFDDDRVVVLAAVPVTSVLIEQDLAAVLVTAVLVKQNLKSSTSLNRG